MGHQHIIVNQMDGLFYLEGSEEPEGEDFCDDLEGDLDVEAELSF